MFLKYLLNAFYMLVNKIKILQILYPEKKCSETTYDANLKKNIYSDFFERTSYFLTNSRVYT